MSAVHREEFATAVERARSDHPTWFDLEPDGALEAERRIEIEDALGALLPDDYVWFLSEYGGGDFAFASIYSADEGSDLYVLPDQDDSLAARAIAFSDDGTGNLFVFPVIDGVADDRVLIYDPDTREVRRSRDETFLSFLYRVGLQSGGGS